MTRSHRLWHLRGWAVLGPLIAAGLWVALAARSDGGVGHDTAPAGRRGAGDEVVPPRRAERTP